MSKLRWLRPTVALVPNRDEVIAQRLVLARRLGQVARQEELAKKQKGAKTSRLKSLPRSRMQAVAVLKDGSPHLLDLYRVAVDNVAELVGDRVEAERLVEEEFAKGWKTRHLYATGWTIDDDPVRRADSGIRGVLNGDDADDAVSYEGRRKRVTRWRKTLTEAGVPVPKRVRYRPT
jgi:hypothetical protein